MSVAFDDIKPFRGSARFELIRQLGSGGMGVVYEALDRNHDARVALKALHHLEPHLLLRLKSEFRSLQGIVHPNLATLFELVHDDGHTFFTMELVDGVRLTQFISSDYDAPTVDHDTVPDVHSDAETISHEPMTAAAPPPPPRRRGRRTYDEQRLRSVLSQLADALAALHRAGKVHRDIKPSNILVTGDGRVVVLDFGLVTDIGDERQSGSNIVGTVDYMAPEQAAGRPVGPEADWYSVGTIMYQVLTGWMPFSGPQLTILQDKQRVEPRAPAAIADCAADLSELCHQMLRTDPAQRPRESEILKRLGAAAGTTHNDRSWSSGSHGSFVGRARELDLLQEAYEASRRGNRTTVLVDGLSGVGKSALVKHFTARLVGRQPAVVVLASRYYEREALPFRALDTVIDAVGRYLARQSTEAAMAVLPTDIGLLATLFPSLRAIEAVSRVEQKLPALDPHEQRVRLFRAVRELFVRLGQRRQVVLVIDDVQWSDPDSRAVFAEAMRPPDGPAVLVVVTMRSHPDDPEASRRAIHWLRKMGDVVHLSIDRLPPAEARELAARLIGRGSGVAPEAIAAEAEGHPLFIDALVRHAVMVGAHRPGALRLDDALRASIDGLDEQARQVLELVCLSGSPLPNDLIARAAALEYATLTRVVVTLRAVHLVRNARVRDQEATEPYHDRVRELVLALAEEQTRRRRHEALARALEASDAREAEALFTHWRGTGDHARAARYAALAAARANETLAFDRAALLYRQALELQTEPDKRRKLWLGLGEALANGGRGPDAADAFAEAAVGAPAHEALDLRRRMAEQLLRSGRIDQGLAAVREVLAAVGLSMPKSPRRALAAFLWQRVRLRMRGYKFRERPSAEVKPADLVRLDACWSVAGVLGMVDTIRGSYFQTVHLRLALAAGEPFRVARALALESGFSAIDGNRGAARTAALVAQAEALAEGVNEPYLTGWVRGAGGCAATLEGRWRAGHDLTWEAEELFRSRCWNIAWELSTFQFFNIYSLAYMGRIRMMKERVPGNLKAAEERGDLYGAAAARTSLATMAWLADDDVAAARARVREAMRHWSRGGFQVEHFWELLAESQHDLYAGDWEQGLARVRTQWKPLAASLLLRVQLSRLEAIHARARVLLAAAAARPSLRRELAASVARDARGIAAERTLWATPMADLLSAAVDVLGDRPAAAAARLRSAAAGFDAAEMALYAAAARWRLGELLGGDEGKALVAAARQWMQDEAIVSPERMLGMLAPGFLP